MVQESSFLSLNIEFRMPSDIFHHLTDKLMGQTFADIDNLKEDYEMAKVAALHHSKTENAIAVLSNIHDDSSFIVYGRLGKHLGLSSEMDNNEVPSIWERELIKRFHEDDIVEKLALELQFITFVKTLPEDCRQDYYLQHVLWMKDAQDNYVYVTHRIYYLRYDNGGNVLLALCLYTIATPEQHQVGIVNSLTGERVKESSTEINTLLSEREKDVLRMIGEGKASKEIADKLCISTHTVNCHRQNILKKIGASNSTEAYNVARKLGII